jgi:GT2 family glycosyltransferase
MKELPSLAITIVTYNSARYIERCVKSITQQDYPNKRVIIVDNASNDSTRESLERLKSECHIVYNSVNTGFAAAQNQAIRLSEARWVLVLNPDVILAPDFLRKLVTTGELDSSAGTVCGKLLALAPSLEPPEKPLLDSTGIFLTPELRHLDRGSRIQDNGQYDRFEYVFGATGAAALYRRAMIDDISIEGEFFDSDFFAYREDADVSWRAQLLGWSCVYCPAAVAYHVRTVLPDNRRHLPSVINMHSVKNRWLLRIKNMTGGLYQRFWIPITIRDLMVIGACFTVELGSLPGLFLVAKKWRTTLRKRREIMSRRRVSDGYLAQWISTDPVGLPAPGLAVLFSDVSGNANRVSD